MKPEMLTQGRGGADEGIPFSANPATLRGISP